MAKRTFMTQAQSWTGQTTATSLTNATYMGIQGVTAAQAVDILEILISGMASASTVGSFDFSPAMTVGTTITALAAPNHDGPNHAYAQALANTVQTYVAATTGPQASNSATLLTLNLALNLFGGIIRWNAAPTQQVTLIGSAANTGSFLLYNSTAGGGQTGSANAHIIYEGY